MKLYKSYIAFHTNLSFGLRGLGGTACPNHKSVQHHQTSVKMHAWVMNLDLFQSCFLQPLQTPICKRC